jgi:hypothetical protein
MANSKILSFYKYFTINQNFYNQIINNELYFSNPRNFNDPFDSNPRFKLTNDKEEVRRLFLKVQKIINDNSKKIKGYKDFEKYHQTCNFLVQDPSGTLIFDYFNSIEPKDFERRIIEIYSFYNFKDILEKTFYISSEKLQIKIYHDLVFLLIDCLKFGISCGSKTPVCPVMWGHYANNHEGVCLEFKLIDENGKRQFCLSNDDVIIISEVAYSNKPLEVFNKEKIQINDFRSDVFNIKSLKWNYENEIRLISNTQGLIKFNQKSLTKVIFGCKTSAKDKYSICRLLANLGYDFEFLVAKMQPDSYEMKIESMELRDIAGSGIYLSELNIDYPDWLKRMM